MMTSIRLNLNDLTPTTLAAIAANLSQNIAEELSDDLDTDYRQMTACLAQLEILVGVEESIELLQEAGADPDIVMAD